MTITKNNPIVSLRQNPINHNHSNRKKTSYHLIALDHGYENCYDQYYNHGNHYDQ